MTMFRYDQFPLIFNGRSDEVLSRDCGRGAPYARFTTGRRSFYDGNNLQDFLQ